MVGWISAVARGVSASADSETIVTGRLLRKFARVRYDCDIPVRGFRWVRRREIFFIGDSSTCRAVVGDCLDRRNCRGLDQGGDYERGNAFDLRALERGTVRRNLASTRFT